MIRRLQREKSDAMPESKHLKRVSEDQKEQISRHRSEKEALEEALRKNEKRISSLLNEVEERKKVFDDLPQWVKHTMRLKKEKEEKEHKKKRKAEADLYTIVKVARDEGFCEQIGKNIYFDFVDHDKVDGFRVKKQLPFTVFKEEVAKEFGIPVQFQRYWLWAERENHTYRPDRPLMALDELKTVGSLTKVSQNLHNAGLNPFLEVELGLDLNPLTPPDKSMDDILILFKLYEPDKDELRYVGRMFVKAVGMPLEILPKLNELAGFSENEEIDLFEEIGSEPNILCEPINKEISFKSNELEDGDIICFQKAIVSEGESNCQHPNVPSFLKSLHDRQVQLSSTGPGRVELEEAEPGNNSEG